MVQTTGTTSPGGRRQPAGALAEPLLHPRRRGPQPSGAVHRQPRGGHRARRRPPRAHGHGALDPRLGPPRRLVHGDEQPERVQQDLRTTGVKSALFPESSSVRQTSTSVRKDGRSDLWTRATSGWKAPPTECRRRSRRVQPPRQNPSLYETCWGRERMELDVDRAEFIEHLQSVRRIRNDVMHFNPDGLDGDQRKKIRNVARFFDQLASMTAAS